MARCAERSQDKSANWQGRANCNNPGQPQVAIAACRHPTETAEAVEIHHCWQPGRRAVVAVAVAAVAVEAVEVVEIHHC